MPAILCLRGSLPRSMPVRFSANCVRRNIFQAGESVPSQRPRSDTIRCHITTARSGLTTTLLSRTVWFGRWTNRLLSKILTGLFDASIFLELHRLPELFCGFPKQQGTGPTLYPVACAPQAWAAGAVFLLLQACLGMEVQATNRVIRFVHPVLPESVPYVRIRGLKVNDSEVDLEITRYHQTVSISILRRVGDVRIVSIK